MDATSKFLRWYKGLVFATPQLTDAETSNLARERDLHAANGNMLGMQNSILKITKGNLHLIYKAYASVHVETEVLEEVFQLGYFVLLSCAKNWSHQRERSFEAYTYYSLKRFLPTALRQTGYQGLMGARLAESRRELRRMEERHAQRGAHLSDNDAARLLGWRQQRVAAVRRASGYETLDVPTRHRAATRIDGVLAEESGHSIPHRVGNVPHPNQDTPEDIAIQNQRLRQMSRDFSLLTNPQRTVVILRFGLRKRRYDQDRTLQEVASLIRLSTERVRNIERKALNQLRDHLVKITNGE